MDEVFALTPQTEEKYKKIDEEFDKMMQSYRLAVSSRVEERLPVLHGVASRRPSAAPDGRPPCAVGGVGRPRAAADLACENPVTLAETRVVSDAAQAGEAWSVPLPGEACVDDVRASADRK